MFSSSYYKSPFLFEEKGLQENEMREKREKVARVWPFNNKLFLCTTLNLFFLCRILICKDYIFYKQINLYIYIYMYEKNILFNNLFKRKT